MDLSYIYIQAIELDQNAIAIANNASRFKAGDLKAREAKNEFNKFAEHFPLHGELTIRQIEYLVECQAQWAELVTTAYNDILHKAWGSVATIPKYNSTATACFAENELLASGKWHEQMDYFLEITQKTLGELSYTAKKRLKKTA